MWLKYPVLIVMFILGAIVQSSLWPYFAIAGVVPNLIFVLFFLIIFFEKKQEYILGFFMALLAGVLLDITMSLNFGVSIVSLLVIYIVYKMVSRFLKEAQGKNLVFYFAMVFSVAFLGYQAVAGASTIPGLAYSLVVAIAIFYLYKNFGAKKSDDNQLKLL